MPDESLSPLDRLQQTFRQLTRTAARARRAAHAQPARHIHNVAVFHQLNPESAEDTLQLAGGLSLIKNRDLIGA